MCRVSPTSYGCGSLSATIRKERASGTALVFVQPHAEAMGELARAAVAVPSIEQCSGQAVVNLPRWGSRARLVFPGEDGLGVATLVRTP